MHRASLQSARERKLSRALLGLVLCVLFAPGCAYPRLVEAPPHTQAWDRPLESALGAALAPQLEAHPGRTGCYLLGSGLDAFVARVLLIEEAEHALDVQYYILHDDVTGRFLLARLLAAAERGVRVRLLVDDVGTKGLDELLAALDAHPALEVRIFNPLARGPLPSVARTLDTLARPRTLNRRMHNKLLAADGAAAIVGGRNLGDEYFDAHEGVNFADLDLLVVGSVMAELGASFDRYWNTPHSVPLGAWPSLRAEEAELEELRAELAQHEQAAQGTPYAERLRGSPLRQALQRGELPLLWARASVLEDRPEKLDLPASEAEPYLLATELWPHFHGVRSELVIVSPYFVPRAGGAAFLGELVERGVRVRVLTNSLAATDVAAVHSGYAHYRRDLLRRGVELYELRPTSESVQKASEKGLFGSSGASLHAKSFLFDGAKVFVGSFNLSPRSVDLNTELGLTVESEELAALLLEAFERITRPDLSWQLVLTGKGGSEAIVWLGEEGGEPVRLLAEPGSSWQRRMQVSFLSLLPIEGQL